MDDLSNWLYLAIAAAAAALGLPVLARRYARRFRPRSDSVAISTTRAVRRGESVDVAITVRDGADTGARLKVGVLCIERYDVEESTETDTGTDIGSGQRSTRRVTREDFAHEEWREVSASEAQQGLPFVVPAEGPYSYRGSCLSFEWQAEALEIARLRPDAVATCTFEVRP